MTNIIELRDKKEIETSRSENIDNEESEGNIWTTKLQCNKNIPTKPTIIGNMIHYILTTLFAITNPD